MISEGGREGEREGMYLAHCGCTQAQRLAFLDRKEGRKGGRGGGKEGRREGGYVPNTLRAYSITAACIPRQMPRKGTLPSRAHRMAPT